MSAPSTSDSSLRTPHWKKLPRRFYLRPTLVVARELLGKFLVRKIGRTRIVGKIVEVEAYREGDPASHSFRGKTQRNDVMFWKGGHLYVYFTYGMHFCANVVTGPEGKGEAVLIRAVEPLQAVEAMMRRRGFGGRSKGTKRTGRWSEDELVNLTNGPAKVCEAFGIGRKQNGTDLLGDKIYITWGEAISRKRVGRSTRIGIRNGRDRKWRFYVKANRWVSPKRK